MLIFRNLVISVRKYFFPHEIKKVKMIPTFIFFRIRNNRFYPIGMEFICHMSKHALRFPKFVSKHVNKKLIKNQFKLVKTHFLQHTMQQPTYSPEEYNIFSFSSASVLFF